MGGGEYTEDDLARSYADWVEPLSTEVFGRRIWTVPPNSQGYPLLLALEILAEFGQPRHRLLAHARPSRGVRPAPSATPHDLGRSSERFPARSPSPGGSSVWSASRFLAAGEHEFSDISVPYAQAAMFRRSVWNGHEPQIKRLVKASLSTSCLAGEKARRRVS
ncbi:gamma-glutamyltransferase [Microtetraspora sp. AC03309]|uniref:gamma-glutamyltransferase n=1 Tax=Microtetraspora sp. AC03309 TaxID=2779376 RepID=UPI0035B019E6